MIEIQNYATHIKKQRILKNINLTLEEGKCYGFVGYNGCGKTMLLRAICGYIKPVSGDILVNGKSMKEAYIENAGILLGEPDFIGGYTGMENLEILASIQKKITKDDIAYWLEKIGLSDAQNKKYRQYSLGMKQKLRIVQAFMENPQYYILDEPFNALDKKSVKIVETMIQEEKEKGKTIFLTSHDERNIENLCDQIFELEDGKVLSC